MTESSTDPYKYFRLEAAELIQKLTRGLLELEKGGDQHDLVNQLNRAAHSMKGAARLVDLATVGDLAHGMESKLSELRGGKSPPTPEEVGDLLKQVDEIDRLVKEAVAESTEPEGDAGLDSGIIPSEIPMPASSSARDEGHSAEGTQASERIVRVATEILDDIGRCAGEMVELGNCSALWLRELEDARRLMLSIVQGIHRERRAVELAIEAALVGVRRPGPQPLFADLDLKSIQDQADSLAKLADGLERISSLGLRLHRLTLASRMTTFEEMSHQFEKTVRDVATELGRRVKLKLTGKKHRVDRLVLQRLTEPIRQLLTNAVVHGIEDAEERAAQKKPAEGKVTLRFQTKSDLLQIVVEDDGRGLDAELIREAATKQTGGDTGEGEDVSQLIFRQGLSTQARLSKVAGRGVGLDVVRSAVEEIGGSVFVKSQPRKSCRFTLEVPSSLDVLEVFALSVGKHTVFIPMARMVKILMVAARDVVDLAGKETIRVDGVPLPLLSLGSLTGLSSEPRDSGSFPVAVIRAQDGKLALSVSALEGKRRLVIKSVGPQLSDCTAIAGAAIMEDGRPAFVLRSDALFEKARVSAGAAPEPRGSGERQPSILVVDDSLTSRMMEKTILEAAGYRVHLAHDGEQALEMLPNLSCDLVLLDYEMPGMNGPEVARRIRALPDAAELPVVMLTSLESEECRREGMAAGVQDYLVKGQFDEAKFLETIRSFVEEIEYC